MTGAAFAVEWTDSFPRIWLGNWIVSAFDWVVDHGEDAFDWIANVTTSAIEWITAVLTWLPAPAMAVTMALIALAAAVTGRLRAQVLATVGGFFAVCLLVAWDKTGLDGLADIVAWVPVVAAVAFVVTIVSRRQCSTLLLPIGAFLLMGFIASMNQWENAMLLLALVLMATLVSLAIGVPLGVASARYGAFSGVIRPVMDLLQTMPAFVWLVPVVTLFHTGVDAGLVATVIFAVPPGVRLTELGIRQVDAEVVEAGHAFGATGGQILREVQVPLAMPTIMAGVNQVIMLALSMAVIAGYVGAPGLGEEVVRSIARIDVGLGFEAGLSVVALAIYLDRVTAAFGRRSVAVSAD